MQAPPATPPLPVTQSCRRAACSPLTDSTKETVPTCKPKLYLSACKVVEQEFHQAEAVRPRLTSIVGAASNESNFPSTKFN